MDIRLDKQMHISKIPVAYLSLSLDPLSTCSNLMVLPQCFCTRPPQTAPAARFHTCPECFWGFLGG